jgi:hypothetical protein
MKKLITLLENISSVDTDLYSKIKFGGTSSSDKINSSLLKDVNDAADDVEIKITIGTAVSGHDKMTTSGRESRHSTGEAVDISRINGVGWSSKSDAESKQILYKIESFVSNLRSKGYVINNESGNPKSVLYFGFPGHNNHIHVSNKVGSSSTDEKSTEEKPTEEKPKSGSETFASKFMSDIITKAAKPIFGFNESKEKRILLNIEKIKNLIK